MKQLEATDCVNRHNSTARLGTSTHIDRKNKKSESGRKGEYDERDGKLVAPIQK